MFVRCIARLLILFLSLAISGVATAEEITGEEIPGLAKLDFRETIKASTQRVFPAVVYVKCVRDSHASGRRRSRQVKLR
jgi:hypothetical protein